MDNNNDGDTVSLDLGTPPTPVSVKAGRGKSTAWLYGSSKVREALAAGKSVYLYDPKALRAWSSARRPGRMDRIARWVHAVTWNLVAPGGVPAQCQCPSCRKVREHDRRGEALDEGSRQ